MKTIQQYLNFSAKDARDSLALCIVYRIPCSCVWVYIGTKNYSMATTIKEYMCSCHLLRSEKSAVTEHVLANNNHHVMFEETKILPSSLHLMSAVLKGDQDTQTLV